MSSHKAESASRLGMGLGGMRYVLNDFNAIDFPLMAPAEYKRFTF